MSLLTWVFPQRSRRLRGRRQDIDRYISPHHPRLPVPAPPVPLPAAMLNTGRPRRFCPRTRLTTAKAAS
eukprot:scaffold3966_cov126-Isochrysis_galbana.AAC.5